MVIEEHVRNRANEKKDNSQNQQENVGLTFNDASSMITHNITTLEQKGFFEKSKRKDNKFSTHKARKFQFGKLTSQLGTISFVNNQI